MRRVVAVASIVALVGALWSGVAVASPGTDLASAFAMQTFGRVPTDAPRFSATADRSLRGLAFHASMPVTLPPLARVIVPSMPTLTIEYDRLFDLADVRLAPPSPSPLATGAYSAAYSSRFALTAPALTRTDDAPPAFSSSLRDAATAYGASTQVGAFYLSGSSASADLTGLSARDVQAQAISSLAVGAKGRQVKFDVGSNYERFSTQAVPTLAYRPVVGAPAKPSIADVPGLSVAQLAGGYSDVTARGVNAGMAVPLTRNLTLGMQYGTQRYTGAVNAQDFSPNFDTSKYSYVGNLTFAIPRSAAAIVVSARQYRFQDNLVPSNSTSETRADVNFTVKF